MRRERDPARLGEDPHPSRRPSRQRGQHEGNAELCRRGSRRATRRLDDHGSEKLRRAREVVGSSPMAAPRTSVGEELGEGARRNPPCSWTPRRERTSSPRTGQGGSESHGQTRARSEGAGGQHRVEGEGGTAAGPVSHEAEGQHPEKLPALRREEPRERARHLLVHLVDEERGQPRVAAPVRAELEDAEEPGRPQLARHPRPKKYLPRAPG